MSLFEAIAAGDGDALRDELERNPDCASERNEEGLSPVLYALYQGQADLVDSILDANPALDVFDTAAVGRTRGLEELLGPEPELAQAFSGDGFTALHYAAFFGQEDAARILLDHGAAVDVVARNPELRVGPLHSAAAGKHAALVRLLLERGAEPDAPQVRGFTPLHAAAENDDRESTEALLAAGADASLRTDDGTTPADLAGERTRDLF